jgi:ABC-type multidrug transport system ATPase subunit
LKLVLLVVRDLVKHWKGAPAPVLDHVDLELDSGKLVAVHGENGAGKTTLLRIVSGLIAPDAGTVSVAGLSPVDQRREFQQRIGFVSAGNGALYARLTVEDHLALWSHLAMLPKDRGARATGEALSAFALDELRGRRVDRLSTGQRQRLRLALGFMHDPELLLLDEPESSLDDRALGLFSDALARARERGGTAIICSPGAKHEHLAIDERYLVANGRLEPR